MEHSTRFHNRRSGYPDYNRPQPPHLDALNNEPTNTHSECIESPLRSMTHTPHTQSHPISRFRVFRPTNPPTINHPTVHQFNKNLNKLKHDLELWREAVLLADTVLKWDKPAYAGIVGAAVTIAYIIVWYLDLSVLTLLSLLGIGVVVLDYAYPIVARMVFRPDQWTGAQEKRYERVCGEVCAVRMRLCAVCQAVFVGKEDKSTKVS